jgi:hypothetical protein
MGWTPREFAIVRSVIYASLFDYPLTLDQLHQTLIESDQTPSEILSTYRNSARVQCVVDYSDGFFFPVGSADLIAERRHREARSRAFLHHYRHVLRVITALPFTRMVALSGSVAHLNLERGGDLDLFIVTRGRRVWTVTVAALLITRLLRRRRVVCVNFIVADSHLVLDQQDLFTANQVIHLKPLAGAEVLDDFVAANPFVRKFYPNGARRYGEAPMDWRRNRLVDRLKTVLEFALALPSPLIEAGCRRLYGWYLQRRAGSWQSPEQVRLQSDYLKLHTRSHRQSVLERFDAAVNLAGQRAKRGSPQAAAR